MTRAARTGAARTGAARPGAPLLVSPLVAPPSASTIELVERVRAGDAGSAQAWSDLVDGHVRLVWKVVRSFDLSAADQQDAFQAAWLRAVEKLHTLRDPERFAGWLATVTANEVRGLLRGRRPTTPLDDESDGIEGSGSGVEALEAVEGAHRATAVRAGLARLDDRCRQLLRLLTTDPPLSYATISGLLGMPHGALGPTRQRCLEKLRRTPEVATLMAGEA
jgi:RNA polymerase sigma factor (sigma-70 family)